MQGLADSRRNMRVDMRAKVVARTMTKELIFAGFGLICAIGNLLICFNILAMPLYYLKIQKIKSKYSEAYQQKLLEGKIELP